MQTVANTTKFMELSDTYLQKWSNLNNPTFHKTLEDAKQGLFVNKTHTIFAWVSRLGVKFSRFANFKSSISTNLPHGPFAHRGLFQNIIERLSFGGSARRLPSYVTKSIGGLVSSYFEISLYCGEPFFHFFLQ